MYLQKDKKIETIIFRLLSGSGNKLTSRIIAEIGDIRRFKNAGSLIAYAGLDAPHINQDNMNQQIGIYLSEVIEK